jgi:integrase/recombinase XerD
MAETTRAQSPKKLPEVLTDAERKKLLAQPNPKAPTGLRNLCMMHLMLNAGLRVAETLGLKNRDLDWMSGKLMVREGKGAKDRTLWLGEDDLELVRTWRERRPVQNELLFVTLQGGRLNDRYIRTMVKRLAQKAGIDKDVHPHTLRHTFATDLYRDTKNIRLVQKALGHADLSTTMIYTHIVDEELEEALKVFRRSA